MHSHKFRSHDLLWSFDCIYFQCAVVVFPHQNLDAITSAIFINISFYETLFCYFSLVNWFGVCYQINPIGQWEKQKTRASGGPPVHMCKKIDFQLAAMTSSEERDFKGIKFFTNKNPSFQFLQYYILKMLCDQIQASLLNYQV